MDNKKITLSAIDTQLTPVVHAVQYDTARELDCYFDDIDISEVTAARIYALKPDGTEVYKNCTVLSDHITAPLSSQTLAVTGTVKCQLQLTVSGTLTTFEFQVVVDKSLVSGSAIPSSNEYTALEQALAEAEAVRKLKDGKCPLYVDTVEFLKYRKRSTVIGNNTFTFSGTAGSGVLSLIGNSVTFTDNVLYAAMVIAYSGANANKYTVCHITAYDNDNQTLTVYPALEYTETAGTLTAFVKDAQHLTEAGFKTYAQYIYGQNPRHCEKTAYLYRYLPINEPNYTTATQYPFTIIGTGFNNKRVGIGTVTPNFPSCSQTTYDLLLYSSAGAAGEQGIEWEVNLNGKAGYFEAFVGNGYRSAGSYSYSVPKDNNYELIIEWYLDDTLTETITKDTNTVQRICFDFENENQTAKVKMYYANGVRANTDNLSLGNMGFYINDYEHGASLIPYGSAMTVMCDSWGANENGATGTELERLINTEVEFETTFYNRSVGGMTARWGKGRFYDFAHKDNASAVLYDFCINDLNGISGGLSSTFTNDNGTSYELYESTYAEYISNIGTLMQMSISNNVLPIWAGCFFLTTTFYEEACARFFEGISQA